MLLLGALDSEYIGYLQLSEANGKHFKKLKMYNANIK